MKDFDWSKFINDRRTQSALAGVGVTALGKALGLGWLPSLGLGAAAGFGGYGLMNWYDKEQARKTAEAAERHNARVQKSLKPDPVQAWRNYKPRTRNERFMDQMIGYAAQSDDGKYTPQTAQDRRAQDEWEAEQFASREAAEREANDAQRWMAERDALDAEESRRNWHKREADAAREYQNRPQAKPVNADEGEQYTDPTGALEYEYANLADAQFRADERRRIAEEKAAAAEAAEAQRYQDEMDAASAIASFDKDAQIEEEQRAAFLSELSRKREAVRARAAALKLLHDSGHFAEKPNHYTGVYGRDPYIMSSSDAWNQTAGKVFTDAANAAKSAYNGGVSWLSNLIKPANTANDPIINEVMGRLTAASLISKSDPEKAMQAINAVTPYIKKMPKDVRSKYYDLLQRVSLMK